MDELIMSLNPRSVSAKKDALTTTDVIKDTKRSFIDTLNSGPLFWHFKYITGIAEICN